MIYVEPEAPEAIGAWDVVEGAGGKLVAIVDGEGIEEGTVVDEGDDVAIAAVVGKHEDANIGTGFGDCGREIFLGIALCEDDHP
jgi:hypothetical protein